MIIPLASFSKLLRGSMISYAVESDGGSNGNGGQASKEGSFPATKVPDSLRRNKILLNARAAIEKGNGNGGKGPSLQEIMTMDDLQLLLNGSLSVAAMASTAGGTWQIASTSSAAQSSPVFLPENGHESAFRRSFSLSSTGQGSETAIFTGSFFETKCWNRLQLPFPDRPFFAHIQSVPEDYPLSM
jgi:hypothetical protein